MESEARHDEQTRRDMRTSDRLVLQGELLVRNLNEHLNNLEALMKERRLRDAGRFRDDVTTAVQPDE